MIGTVLSLASSLNRGRHAYTPTRTVLLSVHRRTAGAIDQVLGGTRAACRADPGSAKRETVMRLRATVAEAESAEVALLAGEGYAVVLHALVHSRRLSSRCPIDLDTERLH